MKKFYIIIFLLFFVFIPASRATLEQLFSGAHWDEVIQESYELLNKNPNNSDAKIKGAYALFQKGHSNAALLFLKKISAQEWKNMPQGRDRLVEVMALFQKKVPSNYLPWQMEQLSTENSSSYIMDELRYLKGRHFYEKKEHDTAKKLLSEVNPNSRYYASSQYLLGSIAVDKSDYTNASRHFSTIFQPSVMSQSSEFWNDMGTQMTSHWGANIKILMTADPLIQSQNLAELGMMALARTSYASHDYEGALNKYGQISSNSKYFSQITLEKIWALLALSKHSEAQNLAMQLSTQEGSFQAIEAKVVRALVLTDATQTDEARKELSSFQKVYESSKKTLQNYHPKNSLQSLPVFIQSDLNNDLRVKSIQVHDQAVNLEIENLKAEDGQMFPVYKRLASELELMKNDSVKLVQQWTQEHIQKRLSDLERLSIQAQLIKVEAFLEDREKLRNEFKQADEKKRIQHDVQLIKLLSQAVNEVDEPLTKSHKHSLELQFRQSELLWELGTAKIILSLANNDKKMDQEGEAHKLAAIKILESLVTKSFRKTDQALFFLGFAYIELEKSREGVKTLLNYVQKYPKHTHVPDAYRILADLSFEENHFKEAENYYKKVLEFPESAFVGYAFYKLGWCGYNQKNFGRALLGLEEAYVWTTASKQAGQLLNLQREARRDLISIYAEIGDHRKALEYFKRLDPETKPWLVDLIKQLEENGQFEKTQDLYAALIDLDGKSEDNLAYQSSIVQSAYKLQRWQVVDESFGELVKRFKSKLTTPNTNELSLEAIVEKNLREVVSSHLNDFRSTSDAAVKERILKLNEYYLSTFYQWPQSQPFLYRHAQFLMENNKLIEASEVFETHWKKFREVIKDPLKEEAIRNLISVLGRLEDGNKIETKPEISIEAKKIIEYTNEYQKLYSDNKYFRPIMFLRSSIQLKYSQTEEAIVTNQKLYDQNPQDDIGQKAFQNLAKAYYDLKDWKRTFEWASKMKGDQKEIKTIREESLFLWAQNTSNDLQAAELFMKISEDPTMESLHDKCLYNAFIHYQKLGRRIESQKAIEKLEKISPQYEGLAKLAGVRASFYQEAGDYLKALPYLETFIKTSGKDLSPEAMYQAKLNIGFIYDAAGNESQASEYFQSYLQATQGTTPSGKAEAERALKKMETKRQPASAPSFNLWPELVKERERFEKNPMPGKEKDLVAKIQAGGLKLQDITKKFIDVSSSEKTPAFYSMESYCVVPFLYARYGNALRELKGQDAELNAELDKVAKPLDDKAQEFAKSCLFQAADSFHMGPVYASVVERWGWQKDSQYKTKMADIAAELEKGYPWIEPPPANTNEDQLKEILLKSGGRQKDDLSIWSQLARLRYEEKKFGLSRLTYADALSKFPDTGSLLNGFACVEYKQGTKEDLIGIFEKAGEKDSAHAWANVALLHLRGLRLEKGLEALKKANRGGAFDNAPQLKEKLKEL